MNTKEIKEIISDVLVEIGASNNGIKNLEKDSFGTDIDLRDYIVDSLMFISFVVELEKRLNIVFPDDLLFISTLTSLNGFVNMLIEIVNTSGEEDSNAQTSNCNC